MMRDYNTAPSPAGTGPLATAGEAVALVVHQDVSVLKEVEYLKDEFILDHEIRKSREKKEVLYLLLLVRSP